jgi:anthranilate synthase component 1
MMTIVVLSQKWQGYGEQEMDRILTLLNTPLTDSIREVTLSDGDIFDHVTSTVTRSQFHEMVNQAKFHIREGDVFQLVLSQRFEVKSAKRPFDVYRDLRLINPSPYMFFFEFGHYQLVGSSPEILVKLDRGMAHLRPIAGTRPRDPVGNLHQESEVVAELLADEKECAEHVMLVDLGRNDLGRVCESVAVTDMMGIEKYSHVMHIVSHIEGKIKSGMTAFELFKATFPAGTVSGAPKVRAIELINEIEPTTRGVYSGAVGYVDFSGNMDMCIAIRTAVAINGSYFVQAGAGLVADSDPDTEYQESQNKARGVLSACL